MASELVQLIPSILWFFLVVVLLILLYLPIRDDLLSNLIPLKAAGLEVSFRCRIILKTISDMLRCNKITAGLKFLGQFRKENKAAPVIFYLAVFDAQKGVPAQSFGVTNGPDELLHLILDVLERKKC